MLNSIRVVPKILSSYSISHYTFKRSIIQEKEKIVLEYLNEDVILAELVP